MSEKNYQSELQPSLLILNSLEKELQKRGEKPELPLETMPDLNYKLWGLHRQKMCVVAARTSNGKSVMAVNMAYDVATQGKMVIFLSLEMPKERIMERMFCLDQQVNNIELLKSGYNKSKEIRDKFELFKRKNIGLKLIVSDCIGKDWEYVDELFKSFTRKPDLVILDHIQEVRGGRDQKQAIDEHISKMRESAIRNSFSLIICSQVNRISQNDKDDKEPQLHHLKATGFLEEAADQVLLLHWPHHYDCNEPENDMIVNVAKNRDGRTGRIKMRFEPQYYRIRDYIKPAEEKNKTRVAFDDD